MDSISHPFEPVYNSQSQVLILGTMPSPKSRDFGFFYMHPRNRFWNVISTIFGEELLFPNKILSNTSDSPIEAAITERRDFLLRHNIAVWDVLASCQIKGAADSSIREAVPNDFTKIFESAPIHHVFCTGKTAYKLWKKFCAREYEERFLLTAQCLPSTSPANIRWTMEQLIEEYKIIKYVIK